MSTMSQFLGGIKSIQRGFVVIASNTGALDTNITISAVNSAKCEVRLLGTAHNGAAGLLLTSATTLTIKRNDTAVSVGFGWEITEWH